MLTLYVKSGCPFSARALIEAKLLKVPLEQKNVADPGVADELIRIGGKKQEPFLVDTERKLSLYGSDEIVQYLHRYFDAKA